MWYNEQKVNGKTTAYISEPQIITTGNAMKRIKLKYKKERKK
jgi:hypothetical protein